MDIEKIKSEERIEVGCQKIFKDCLRLNNIKVEKLEMPPSLAKLYGIPIFERKYIPNDEAWMFSGNKVVIIKLK